MTIAALFTCASPLKSNALNLDTLHTFFQPSRNIASTNVENPHVDTLHMGRSQRGAHHLDGGLRDMDFNPLAGIHEAITDASDAVSSLLQDPVGTLEKAATEAHGFIKDELLADGGLLDDVMDVVTSGSFGSMLNTGLDKLGLPDWIGDVAGGALDFCTGNYVGFAANALDAAEDLAMACGGDEIAGFLKTASSVTGMFAGGSSLGQAGEAIAAATSVLESGASMLAKAGEGDWLGAAGEGFGILAQSQGWGGELGLDADTIADIAEIGVKGGEVTSWIDQAMTDGTFGLDDVLTSPLLDGLAEEAGLDPDLVGVVKTFGARGADVDALFEMLTDYAGSELTGAGLELLEDQLVSLEADPELTKLAMSLLSQDVNPQEVDLKSILSRNIRM